MTAAGMIATKPANPAIRPSLELASTRSRSSRTTDGTSACLDTRYVFWRTSAANTSGNRARLSIAAAISSEITMRAAATSWMTVRRPPAARSMTGPISGAMTTNGAKLTMRKRRTRPRAALGSMLKKSESARATIIAASPPTIAAWVTLRRRNFETGARAVTTPMLETSDPPRSHIGA